MKGVGRRILALGLAPMVILGSGLSGTAASAAAAQEKTVKTDMVRPAAEGSYAAYRQLYIDRAAPKGEAILDMSKARPNDAADTDLSQDGKELTVLGEGGEVSWEFEVQEEGLYCLEFTYRTEESLHSKISFSLLLDGAAPYDEWERLTLDRPYRYVPSGTEELFIKDDRGNDVQPQQELSDDKVIRNLYDADGKYNAPLAVYLTPGAHRLTMSFSQADVTLMGMRFHPQSAADTYETVYAEKKAEGAADTAGEEIILQGEGFSRKSDAGIQAGYDKSSAATWPSSPAVMSLNMMGGTNWQNNGQWVEWSFEVEKSGFYEISFRARQNAKYGMSVLRRIWIDDALPFAEMEVQAFDYSRGWTIKTLGGEDAYKFYLEAGPHTLRMDIVSGEYESAILTLTDALTELNAVYRSIVMVTGTSPDSLRDYDLEASIPELPDRLKALLQTLEQQREYLESGLIGAGSETSYLDALIVQITAFLKDTETIPYRLDSFKTNISSLADWIATLSEQPLELDVISIHSPDKMTVKKSQGFFRELWYKLQVIFCSFSKDYGMVGDYSDGDETLDVWMNLGRDQMQVLKGMIDSSFVPEKGIRVNLSLVQGGLIEAVLAGKGPDVALFVASTDPVNLAARGAVTPLSDFEDFDQVRENFFDNNLIPYRYKDKVYGLPCTAEFPMMFVRTDVLEELGLSIPQTWDELIDTAAVLQRKNLQIGIPSGAAGGSGLYSTFLIQQGVTYYEEDFSAARFGEEEAIDAFTMFTDFFTKYDFPLSYNFFNRFRTGEMPIGIDSYTVYNYLEAAAPEISGLWTMAPVPSTVREDGSLCGTTTNLNSTAAIMLKTDLKDQAWTFIKWFVSTDVQGQFGTSIEASLGASGRYATANKEAIKQLPWTTAQSTTLLQQWNTVTEMGVIPATYIVERNLSNAFKKVVYNGKNARETLTTYTFTINQEIARKNEELAKREKGAAS